MKKAIVKFFCLLAISAGATEAINAQTFFETAKDDGIVNFTTKSLTQLKLNLSSTAVGLGYNYVGGKTVDKTRLLFNGEFKIKPNDDGIATLVKNGELQPGLKVNTAIGVRIVEPIKAFFSAFDFYIKPTYILNGYTIYDSVRGSTGADPVYDINKHSFGLNLLVNGVLAPGRVNIFFGVQYGKNWTNNGEDLDKGTVQTITSYAGSPLQSLITNQKDVKYGVLKNLNKSPLKIDLIFDPRIKLNHSDKTNIDLGIFGYYRTDGASKKYRSGFGVCFLNDKDPSKIFASLGYELPGFGNDVTAET